LTNCQNTKSALETLFRTNCYTFRLTGQRLPSVEVSS